MHITSNTFQSGPNQKEKNELNSKYQKYFETAAKPGPTRLYVRPAAKAKQDLYVKLVPVEIGWMGFVKIWERQDEETGLILPGVLVLEDVFLYEQEVSGSSVDSGIDEGIDIHPILDTLAKDGKADQIDQLRYFAHSHANFGTYHSGTDTGQINTWAATGLDWFISCVQNKKNEIDCRLDVITPFRMSVPVEMVELTVQNPYEEAVAAEIDANVTKKQMYTKPYHHTTHGGYTPGSYNKQSNKGVVFSEQFGNPNPEDTTPQTGTVEFPVVRHRKMKVQATGSVEDIRQEVVFGIIIHEAITGSDAARGRMGMSNAEKWIYWHKFVEMHPDVEEKTRELRRQFEGSRSIDRSNEKRAEGNAQGPSSETVKDDSGQTQTQDDQPNVSSEKKTVKQSRTSRGESSVKKETDNDKQSKDEESQQKLVVIQGEKEEVKEEVALTPEEQVEQAFAGLGYDF